MLKKIFLSFLFVLIPSCVYADNFFPSGELDKNMYFDTLVLGISGIPVSGRCAGCIEYNLSDVVGSYSDDIFSGVNMSDLVYPDSSYGLVRIPGVYDQVSLPPFSFVDFIYFYQNDANKVVNITELGVFLSYKQDRGLHTISNVSGEDAIVSVKYGSYTFVREGIAKRYDGIGIVNKWSGGSVILDTIQVSSPLIFEKWEVAFNGRDVDLKVTVKSNTNEYLENVEYEHNGFLLKRNFSSYETYTYEYSLTDINEESLGYPSIFLPGVRRNCAVQGEPIESISVNKSAILYGVREESGVYLNYISSRVKSLGSSFCIERIPFRLYSPELIKKNEESEQPVKLPEQEVLGGTDTDFMPDLKKLPQTNMINVYVYIPVFLVVMAILCYYLRRRSHK